MCGGRMSEAAQCLIYCKWQNVVMVYNVVMAQCLGGTIMLWPHYCVPQCLGGSKSVWQDA